MGQKTNPVGYRLGFIKTWNSQWFDEKDFSKKLNEDLLIRRYIKKRMADGAVSKIEIERTAKKIVVTVHTARPGVVIGKKGAEVDLLKEELKKLLQKKDIQININEIKHPELDSLLVAQNIARQLEGKVSFRRAMKRSITSAANPRSRATRRTCYRTAPVPVSRSTRTYTFSTSKRST